MRLLRRLFVLSALIGIVGVHSSLSIAAESAKPSETPTDLVLKGDAKCTGCHDETDDAKPTMLELHPSVLSIGKTRHGTQADGRTPTCTDCHGESEKHRTFRGSGDQPLTDRDFRKNTKTSAEDRNGACTSCHKGGDHMFWPTSTHSTNDVVCSDCHQVHRSEDKVLDKRTQPEVCYTCHKQQRAEMSKPSHHPVPEGSMGCSDCHSPHGSPGQSQLVRVTVNETCNTCHMEKRGPFINNHQPVSENCGICHNPHGTISPNLLKTRPPFLCQECHEGAQHPSTSSPAGLPIATAAGNGPGGRGAMSSVGRGCVNCHTNIHGSNSPLNSTTAGDRLTR